MDRWRTEVNPSNCRASEKRGCWKAEMWVKTGRGRSNTSPSATVVLCFTASNGVMRSCIYVYSFFFLNSLSMCVPQYSHRYIAADRCHREKQLLESTQTKFKSRCQSQPYRLVMEGRRCNFLFFFFSLRSLIEVR